MTLVDNTGAPMQRGLLRRSRHANLTAAEQLDLPLDPDWINTLVERARTAPMPVPVGYRIMLLVITPPEKVGNVHLAQQSQDRIGAGSHVAFVMRLGPDAYDHEKFKGRPWCQPGDLVLIERYAGRQFEWFNGLTIAMVDDDKIGGRMPRIDEPAYEDASQPDGSGDGDAASTDAA